MSGKGKGCPGKEVFQRINYLYQASALMAGKNNTLSCYYGNLLKAVAKKAVLRMLHSDIKRSICKKCGLMLKPEITLKILVKENDSAIEMQCLKCDYIKTYNINPNYNLWTEDPQSIIEVYTFKS